MNLPGTEEPFAAGGFRRLIQAVRALAAGGTNAAGAFTLTPGAAETVVQNTFCGEASLPLLTPFSATAGDSQWWIKSVGRGRFTVGHVLVGAGADFRYELRQP